VEKEATKYLVNARALKTKKLAKILQFFPFIRCVILNGSLAEGRAKKGSDIDILIVAQSGRVFSVRFFIAVLTSILGIKRSSNGTKNHAGKFCFNYYLTDDYLEIPHDRTDIINAYCARNYSQSILVWGDENIFSEYCQVNIDWMQKYLKSQGINNKSINIFPIVENWVTKQFPIGNIRAKRVGQWWERRLSNKFGDWIEIQVKKFQIWLIEKDYRTWKYPNFVVYNDRELRFHPPKNRS